MRIERHSIVAALRRRLVPSLFLAAVLPSIRESSIVTCLSIPTRKHPSKGGRQRYDRKRRSDTFRKLRGAGDILRTTPGFLLSGGGGGGSSSRLRSENVIDQQRRRSERRRKNGMAAALFSTYFAVMGAKCALPSTLSLLTTPGTGLVFPPQASAPPQKLMANVLASSTIAIALGKFLLGPIIDNIGGILSLKAALSILGLLLGTVASADQFRTFALCWIGVDFLFSSCWAGCLNAIHQSFDEQEWASRVGMLAVAARAGNALAFFAFSGVLHWAELASEGSRGFTGQSWRLVFWMSSLIQLIPLSLLSIFGKPNNDEVATGKLATTSRPTIVASLQILRREASTPEFWLHFLSRSSLMVFGSFLLFVPTFLSNCYDMSASLSAAGGSIFALGCLLSVSLGAERYSKLTKRNKAISVFALMGVATTCALSQLTHVTDLFPLTPALGLASMFVWGFSFAIPFYIPPSLYALRRGGKESSATIADAFDLCGFGSLALFNGYVASIRHEILASWTVTFVALAGCSILSMASLPLALSLE